MDGEGIRLPQFLDPQSLTIHMSLSNADASIVIIMIPFLYYFVCLHSALIYVINLNKS